MAPFEVRLLDASLWRDWMPIVQEPGADGGSPLYARIELDLHNRGRTPLRLTWHVELVVGAKVYALPFQAQDKTGKTWTGRLGADARQVVELFTRAGPYLAVGTEVYARAVFSADDGERVTMETPVHAIERTD